ncbi:MAG: TatD family hydrolase [Peptoniphilaceae bacterium]|nr:TatD family hydrolase [Peptoniphilaceae bacterium]MDD7383835.1 TatD family hydrolase [Peptoniphilaceae bacterium]MDY3737588.1 TatD family hydrolase [Peptoniphilaceae bacterium]
MHLIDSHCHLTSNDFDKNRDFIISDLKNWGVDKIVNPSDTINSSIKALELSKKYSNVFIAVGIHPENADEYKKEDLYILEKLASFKRTVAIGEIGLDYHWKDDNKNIQKQCFIDQLELAKKLKLPVVVHSRDTNDEVYDILKNFSDLKVQIHSFEGDKKLLKKYIDLGFFISLGGAVTWKNKDLYREVVSNIPIDRLMLETDSPYLSPYPLRGILNDPRKIVFIAEKLAEIYNMKLENFTKKVTKNTERFFDI